MYKARHIITFLLCVIIAYTGSGFAEIHYKCVGCVDKSLHLSRLFFPSKISAESTHMCECGCTGMQHSQTKKSCCGESPSKQKSGNCQTTKITKWDITNEITTVDVPALYCVPSTGIYQYDFQLTAIDNYTTQFIEDTSPPPDTGLYSIIYCTLLI